MTDSDGMIKPGVGEALTEREREILACLVEGLSNPEIAARLHLALKTVKWYNSQIYSKLGVTNRQEAIARVESKEQEAPTVTRHNLPVQMTLFVGRTAELVEIARLLSDPAVKLVTILAPGGMGKTRLALEAARQQLPHFADGVFVVPLVAARSVGDVVTTIAENIGLSLIGDEESRQQLFNYFRERKTLLLLDNFEHLLDSATLVAELIQIAPNITVLVTSREKLNLRGEMVFDLSGLDFPDEKTSAAALDYDAAQLFMQSAQHTRSRLALPEEDMPHLARICRLTAGMPLALVLAAGWLDVLTMEQIAAEIQKGIDILETEMRDMPERQRSIRATFNTTWERLTDAERSTFMNLSVFRGGFTVEAAQIVAGATIRLLRSLAGKALIQTLPGGRYDVHELLRQYAEEKLDETGAADSVKRMHSRYYLEFLAQRRDTIHSHKMSEILNEVAADFDNIRAAWHYAAENRDDQWISGAVECLTWFCDIRGRFFEHEELYALAQERFAPSAGEKPLLVWGQLMSRRATEMMQYSPSDETIKLAKSFHEKGLAVVHLHEDLFEMAYTTFRWGDFLVRTRHADALTPLEQSLALFQDIGNQFYISECWFWMACHYENVGMLEQVFDYLQRSADLKIQVGDKSGAGWALWLVSYTNFGTGVDSDADATLREALRLFQEVGNLNAISFAMCGLAYVAFRKGDLEAAHRLATENLRKIVDAQFPTVELMVTELLGIITFIRDEPNKQVSYHTMSLYETGRPYVDAVGLIALCALGQYEDTRQTLSLLLTRRGGKLNFATLTNIYPVAAIILANQGQEERAVELFSLTLAQPTAYVGWVSRWGLVTRLLARLERDLGTEVYAAAWERGKVLDLVAVEGMLRAEFGERGS